MPYKNKFLGDIFITVHNIRNVPCESLLLPGLKNGSWQQSSGVAQAAEVALTIACPNRSRAAGYND